MVASCKLPLGMPSLSLLATSCLFLFAGLAVGAGHGQGFGEATDRAFVADESVALDDDTKEHCVVVAVGCGGDDAQAIAAGLALHPQLLAGAAPEGDEAGFEGFGVADGVEKAQHQHLAGACILNDAGNEAVHLVKVDCGIRIAHFHPCLGDFPVVFLCSRKKKPAQRVRRRASELFDLSGRLHQAITVRRHGVSMMMVVTVMAVALHLIQTIKETTARCQPWLPSKL